MSGREYGDRGRRTDRGASDAPGATAETASDREDSRFLDLYPGEQDGSPEALRDEVEFRRHVSDSLVDGFPDGVFVVDDEGTITHVNTRHNGIDDDNVGEVLGLNAAELFGTDETLADEVVRKNPTIREDQVRSNVSQDGTEYHVRAGATTITTPDGEVVGAFEVVTDVTALVEQRRTMETLQEQMADEVNVVVEDLLKLSERVSDIRECIGQIEEHLQETTE